MQLKCIIIRRAEHAVGAGTDNNHFGRYYGEEESEDTYPAKPVKPTLTRRDKKAGERPASKSCQAHQQRTGTYIGLEPKIFAALQRLFGTSTDSGKF